MQICIRPRGGSLLLGCVVVGVLTAGAARAEIGDLVADSVIGQSSFTDSVALAIGPATFGKPTGVAIDRAHKRVYVSDSLNHRVLGWSDIDSLTDGAAADLVIGQPDFFSWGCNRSMDNSAQPATLDSLCNPAGLAVDSDGNLYVADSGNCRVLVFNDPFGTDQVADIVLGAADGKCGLDATHFYDLNGVAVDGSGNVYVADTLNCRVLEFDGPLASTDTTADRVYGQPDFTTGLGGKYNPALYFPDSVAVDPSGRLYVGSHAYVYEFDNPLGAPGAHLQADHTFGGDCSTETASSTCFPVGVATDSTGRLYVADAINSRVLEFDSPLTVFQAARVFGQASFGPPPGGTTFCGNEACNVGGPSASSLCLGNYSGSEVSCGLYYDAAVAVDDGDNLWVADGFNNRVLRYVNPLSDQAADLVLGQPTMASIRAPVVPLDGPSGLGGALVVDTNNSRVIVYGSFGRYNRPVAVFGQPDMNSTGCNTGGLSARSLCNPTAVLVGGSSLWIADTGNNRVLRFDSPLTNKQDADQVFGQPDFTSNGCGLGNAGLCAPRGLAIDAHGDLYISDSGNNRIMIDENPQTNDRKAELVLGQPDFNSGDCTPQAGGADKLCDPRGITVLSHLDPWFIDQGDDLYVADRANNRVVLYSTVLSKANGAPADKVFGQGDDMNTGSCGQGAGGLCGPTAVATDRAGDLLVADTDNNRVLEYTDPLTDTTADRVFGQSNFTDHSCNAGGTSPTAASLCQPAGVMASGDYEGSVLIADTGNNRVLGYEAPYCIENYSLTAANRKLRGIRSKPTRTKVQIEYGSGSSDDTVKLSDHLILLELDGSIYENNAPLFTLSTDSAFSTGIVFSERVPQFISNTRVTRNGGTWTTGELELSHGITFYKITTSFYIPPGFSDKPQRDRITYSATAVGMDLSGFTEQQAWFRAQFGSTCFTTELRCVLRASGKRVCRLARATN
jgi:sugar lactone lactonase YvrE